MPEIKLPNKYTCVSSILLLLSEPSEYAKVKFSRYFHHKKMKAFFLKKKGGRVGRVVPNK